MSMVDATCPTCWAKPGDRCRTRRTKRVTDTHEARYWQRVRDIHVSLYGADHTCDQCAHAAKVGAA
jgi:hypothetical protein